MRVSIVALAWSIAACGGDDSLGQTFTPNDEGPVIPDNRSPIAVGNYGFSIDSTYFLNRGEDLSGGPQRASAVALCIRLDEVNAEDAAATVQLSGIGAAEPILVDSTASTTDMSVIDGSLAPLWVKAIAYPTSESLSASQFFTLRNGLRPDETLRVFPFIEVREGDGWDGFDDVVANTLAWFQGPPIRLEDNQFFDSAFFDLRTRESEDTLVANLAWRETADAQYPAEIRGPVIHALRIEYTLAGVLAAVREWVVPDDTPDAPLDADLDYGLQCDLEPCLFSLVSAERFDDLFCAF